ncbi:EAL domain-containing protein [Paucibacter soli]|uniref:EAL domain-containing protein n=1 Tax=Paucibacter soli TaxID=3133433 RepID=UPI0030B238AB
MHQTAASSSKEAAGLLARLEFLEFTPQDAQLLAELHEELEGHKQQFADTFYAHLCKFEALRKLIPPKGLDHLSKMQSRYFSSLTEGRYDADYVRERQRVGLVHQRIGLAPDWYLGAYRKYLAELHPVLLGACKGDAARFATVLNAILKIIFFDIGIALDAYFGADKKAVEEAREVAEQVNHVFQATSLNTGEEFLTGLCSELAATLGLSFAMVARFADHDGRRAETLALVHQGQVLANFGYAMADTPCDNVREKGLCIYPAGIQALFPRDLLLAEMGLESYAGIPLHDRNGKPLGVLAVFCTAPLPDPERAGRLLQVFSLRAETELERLQAARRLADSEARLRSAFDQAAVGIVQTRPDGEICLVNACACALLGIPPPPEPHGALLQRAMAPYHGMLAELAQDPKRVLRAQRRVELPGDGTQWLALTASAIVDAAGQMTHMQLVFEDISQRKQLEQTLHLYGRALASSSSGILITDALAPDQPIVFVNDAFCRMTGYERAEVMGRNCRFLQSADRQQPELTILREALSQQREAHVVLRNYRRDGGMFWNDALISPVPDEQGRVTHFIGIQTDVSEKRMYEEQLAYQATHDPLTGLPNRTLLDDRLDQALRRAQRHGGAVAVLFLDVDSFKFVNDSFGHSTGDLLLQTLAARLHARLRDGDTVARYGGDEFVVLLNDLTEPTNVNTICEGILRAMALPLELQGQEFQPSLSIGVALYPHDAKDRDSLYKFADMALYRAKELSRGGYRFFSQDMNTLTLERVKLESALRVALRQGDLDLHYQPIVDLRDGRVVGVEALARWTHAELGAVAPDRFIRVAEDCGLIAALGLWVMRRACRDLRGWLNAGLGEIYVAVNVSARQFREPDLVSSFEACLQEFDILPSQLTLEITESVLLHDMAANERTLHLLKQLGFSLAMDDFGTGYSSLSYLKRLPFDTVKIDRSFIRDVACDQSDKALARSIVSMAHSLGIRVVAEGVETEAQCRLLSQTCCDLIQGYLFSPALPPGELAALMRDGLRLPEHLQRAQRPVRTLLLVDDEPSVTAALKRLLHRDGYRILTAASALQGLELLAQHEVGVIVSDQRMPGMVGTDFLRAARQHYPNTIRIILSGYTELESVTRAVNEGAVYKFLTKPWDNDELREHIAEAFRLRELADENGRLDAEIRSANMELAAANRRLQAALSAQTSKPAAV